MPKVLIVPLDWGLGHLTRCIPIIKHLQKADCEVTVAGEGASLKLLTQEFPLLTTVNLAGYRINYSLRKRFFTLKILLQLPKIFRRIKAENVWLDKIIDSNNIDIVISDNRYGLFTKKIPCFFITHQLHISAPSKYLENKIQKIAYNFINRYSECWVPDFQGSLNVAGKLSHPLNFPKTPTKFIGILSRFEKKGKREKKYDWMVVLSGPEPQRTLLEKKLLKTISQLSGTILFVRGLPLCDEKIDVPKNCTLKNHLATNEMQQAFEESEFIISRSGYTTIMEILSLQKKSILIPTPGQTEQEYLADHLMKQHWCYAFRQDDDVLTHLQKATTFNFNLPQLPQNDLEKTIGELLNTF
jgi:uncharacterized protein (TIGR00661 family)